MITGRTPRVGAPGDPLDLAGRQAEHLAQLADGAADAERREGRDQRCAVMAETLVHAGDQPLTDVPGEVEVDVGKPVQVFVQEPSQRQSVLHGVDVGEAGQVADE